MSDTNQDVARILRGFAEDIRAMSIDDITRLRDGKRQAMERRAGEMLVRLEQRGTMPHEASRRVREVIDERDRFADAMLGVVVFSHVAGSDPEFDNDLPDSEFCEREAMRFVRVAEMLDFNPIPHEFRTPQMQKDEYAKKLYPEMSSQAARVRKLSNAMKTGEVPFIQINRQTYVFDRRLISETGH